MKKKLWIVPLILLIGIGLVVGGCQLYEKNLPFGFAREVSPEEQVLRFSVVSAAEAWLGCNEQDGSHKQIIDMYNAHEPLAVNYTVQYTDEWCATFGSTVAIQCGLTGIIPTECGCQRQIALFDALGRWQEDDAYVPLPGDYIFYSIGNYAPGDCVEWSNHVGIVVGTNEKYIKVIEGNNNEAVAYRVIAINHSSIRGFGLPDYASAVTK